MKEPLKISRVIKELFVICSRKHIDMTLELEGEINKIDFNPELKLLEITVPHLDDDKFTNELIKLHKEIKVSL